MSGLDKYFGGYQTIQSDGVALPQRLVLDVGSGLTAVDDPTNNRTIISGSGSSALSLASAWNDAVGVTIPSASASISIVSSTITPLSTGLIHLQVDGMLSTISGSSAVAIAVCLNGAGIDDSSYFVEAGVTGDEFCIAPACFSVDLDRLGTPFLAPVGTPLTVAILGSCEGPPCTARMTLTIQERSQ